VGIQEGNKGVRVDRQIGRSDVKEEKQARRKLLPLRYFRKSFSQPKDDK
jgi:hypothetical protein